MFMRSLVNEDYLQDYQSFTSTHRKNGEVIIDI